MLKKMTRDCETAKAVQSEEKDFDPTCHFDAPPLMPNGNYQMVFVKAEVKTLWAKKRAFLHFRIVQQCVYFGQVLWMSCVIPANGKFSLSSKYPMQWSIAAGRPPSRHDRLTAKVFKGKVFLARIREVKSFHDGKERHVEQRYSVIDSLIEVQAGA